MSSRDVFAGVSVVIEMANDASETYISILGSDQQVRSQRVLSHKQDTLLWLYIFEKFGQAKR
jgi:hypothetical protein